MSSSMGYTILDVEPRDAHQMRPVRRLLARCQAGSNRAPLSDHALSALSGNGSTIRAFAVVDTCSRHLAYAQATPAVHPTTAETPPTWTIDISIDPICHRDHASILDTTLEAVLARVRACGNHPVQWWCHEPTETDCAIAEQHGLTPTRQLLEMRTTVGSIPHRSGVVTRPLMLGVDEPSLLEVNNLAFAHHSDQGNWNHDSLAGRFGSEWFDPAGLLVHTDEAGTIVGFCWTKIHRLANTAPLGEIYVVAVRPSHHGRGLGRALVHSGLASLQQRHIEQVMLFVDGSNTTARRLYHQLGFRVTSTTTAFSHRLETQRRSHRPRSS
jgi:mycothiol synthase